MVVVTIGTTAQTAVSGNRNRKTLSLTNLDSTNTIYFNIFERNQAVPTTTGGDYTLGPGIAAVFTLLLDGQIETQGTIVAIANAGTPKLGIAEQLVNP